MEKSEQASGTDMEKQKIIEQAYAAFNIRDIDAILRLMHPDVHWPKGFEGGFVSGHENVRDYWTRQWQEINPNVTPAAIKNRADGTLEVEVHQVVKDLLGNQLSDVTVCHIYKFDGELIVEMNIEGA